MKNKSTRTGATLCSSMRPRSATTSWLNKFKLLAFAFMALLSINVWGETVNITMGNAAGKWNIQALSSSYTDTYGQEWSSSANTSAGSNGSQVGSSSTTCTSLILTTTANETFQLASLTLYTAGSGNGASGSWAFTINGVSVSSGATISGSGATSVTLSSPTKVNSGEIIALTYTGTAKGVKATSLTYTYSAISADPYTVIFNAGSGTCSTSSLTEESAGAGVILPTPTISCGDWAFAGWKETSAQAETTTVPTLFAAGSKYTPSDNCTLYAVYSKTESGGTSQRETTLDMSDLLGKTITEENTLNGFTLLFAANGGTTPVINASAEDARLYAKGTLSISSDATMTAISFIISTQGKKRLATISSSTGSMTISGADAYECSWSGSAKAVTFTVGENADYGSDGSSKAGQLDFDDIVISYSGGSTTTYNSNPDCGPSTYTLLYSGHKSWHFRAFLFAPS